MDRGNTKKWMVMKRHVEVIVTHLQTIEYLLLVWNHCFRFLQESFSHRSTFTVIVICGYDQRTWCIITSIQSERTTIYIDVRRCRNLRHCVILVVGTVIHEGERRRRRCTRWRWWRVCFFFVMMLISPVQKIFKQCRRVLRRKRKRWWWWRCCSCCCRWWWFCRRYCSPYFNEWHDQCSFSTFVSIWTVLVGR